MAFINSVAGSFNENESWKWGDTYVGAYATDAHGQSSGHTLDISYGNSDLVRADLYNDDDDYGLNLSDDDEDRGTVILGEGDDDIYDDVPELEQVVPDPEVEEKKDSSGTSDGDTERYNHLYDYERYMEQYRSDDEEENDAEVDEEAIWAQADAEEAILTGKGKKPAAVKRASSVGGGG